MKAQQTRQGIMFALGAYLIWGLAPAYFKTIQQVAPPEIMTHRVIWSFFFMLFLISITHSWGDVRALLRQPHKILWLGVTAVVVASNWLLYIWAVNNHHILESSLGYFINPLVNVVMGMVFLGEQFRRLQWVAVALATCGVLIQIWQFGSVPYIALGITLSFSTYGLLRKKIAVNAQAGMLLETCWLLIPASVYLFAIADSPTSHLAQNPISLNLLLISAGIVTTVPLLLFTAACLRLRLSTIGFFQYLGPTLMFLQAVLFYGEQLTPDKAVTFAFIWAALLLFITDALLMRGRPRV